MLVYSTVHPDLIQKPRQNEKLLIQIVRNGLSQSVGYGGFLFIPFELSDLENKNQTVHNILIKKIISTVKNLTYCKTKAKKLNFLKLSCQVLNFCKNFIEASVNTPKNH